MSTFTLTVDMDNDAFAENPAELSRILHDLAQWLDHDCGSMATQGTVRDANGNTVGRWSM